jgi:pimeloyl-ACP methyl ester carboxylesterase
MSTSLTGSYERVPLLVVFTDDSPVRDTYGGTGEIVALEAHLLRPEKASDTVIVFMHPIGGGAYLPMTVALAKAGHHVIYCNSRYRGVDSALIMEKVTQDLAECVRYAKEKLGYSRVVLAGWSGGGALSAFYQAQAEHPTVTHTPAGDPFDLTAMNLIPADGLMLLAAHVSRHQTLTEWMDPSLLDEHDPTVRDPELDLYNPDNPNPRTARSSWSATARRRSPATGGSPRG